MCTTRTGARRKTASSPSPRLHVGVIAPRPLANGLLAGSYGRDSTWGKGRHPRPHAAPLRGAARRGGERVKSWPAGWRDAVGAVGAPLRAGQRRRIGRDCGMKTVAQVETPLSGAMCRTNRPFSRPRRNINVGCSPMRVRPPSPISKARDSGFMTAPSSTAYPQFHGSGKRPLFEERRGRVGTAGRLHSSAKPRRTSTSTSPGRCPCPRR